MTDATGSSFQQQEWSFMKYPADGWRKLMFKAPLTLWRMGLGPLMGHVFLVIGHTGRKSGLPRYTMVEHHVTSDGRIIAPCAFGDKAQWYKNMVADPHVTIENHHGAFSMVARRIEKDDELLAAYTLFNKRNPMMFGEYLETLGIANTPGDVLAHKDRVVLITFDPTDTPTPPPLEVDLQWVWWVIGAILLGLLRTRKKRQ